MIDALKQCPKCKAEEACWIEDINETAKAYNCYSCGYATNDFMVEEEFDFAEYESTLPELYKDISQVDEEGRVWYPHVINILTKGTVFASGKSKDDWQWSAIKSIALTEEEMGNPRYKNATHKSDPTTLKNFGNDYFAACDYVGLFNIQE
jgi:hypothetical protein